MGKTLKYGSHDFPKSFGFSSGASDAPPAGKKLVQFYAGGGKVKKAAGGVAGKMPGGATPPAVPKPAKGAPAAMPKGPAPAVAAVPAAPRGPKGGGKGLPNLMERAKRPGGMATGGLTKKAGGGVPAFSSKPKVGC